jgi:hypothetical protein
MSPGVALNVLPRVFRPLSSRQFGASLAAIFAVLSMSACQPSTAVTDAGPMVGADTQAHGCKGSAGYVWSAVQQRCLRLFEDGYSFDPAVDHPDQTLKAFLVLAPEAGQSRQAELFLPQSASPITLEVVYTPEGDTRPLVLRNVAQQVEVVRVKDMFVLSVQGQVKFTHDALIDSPMHSLGKF